MARHIERRTAVITGVAALVLGFGTLGLLAQATELGAMEEALRRARARWLPLCLLGLAVSYAGYLVAYRDFARARGGPELRLSTLARVVLAGFGANAIGSGTAGLAVDYWALRRAGERPHDAGLRVLAFNTMEWAVLGTMAAVAGALTLAGLGAAPAAVALPWAVGVPVCAAAALAVSAPARAVRLSTPPPRLPPGAAPLRRRAARGVRAAFAAAVGGLVLIRHVVRHPARHPGGAVGYLAYWGGQLLVLEAALRAFGEALAPAPLVLAYATAYVASALPLPGGAGGIEASLALLLNLMGVPLAVAVLAVLVHRLVTFWLPILPALATLPWLRRLGTALPAEGRRRVGSFPPTRAGVATGLPQPDREVDVGMDFNPIDVQKALKGADYPSSGEDLAARAQENGASDELVEQLRGLGGGEISGPDQVMKQLAK